VIAYGVSQRTYEIGLRMALGAQHGSVLTLVMTQGHAHGVARLAVGMLGALAIARAPALAARGGVAVDGPTLGVVALTLTGVAALACVLPARRATRVSPTEALRAE
jgi:putative ABC transport system permease protein